MVGFSRLVVWCVMSREWRCVWKLVSVMGLLFVCVVGLCVCGGC